MSLLESIRVNSVQSIRAYRVPDLQAAALEAGHHFLVANCSNCTNKQQVLAEIAQNFDFPNHFGENFDALYDCLTSMMYKAGAQAGFVVVIEHIPSSPDFDKEARETLLDVFRDSADYWEKKKVPFRAFYSYS